jgi:hypothetical protein
LVDGVDKNNEIILKPRKRCSADEITKIKLDCEMLQTLTSRESHKIRDNASTGKESNIDLPRITSNFENDDFFWLQQIYALLKVNYKNECHDLSTK